MLVVAKRSQRTTYRLNHLSVCSSVVLSTGRLLRHQRAERFCLPNLFHVVECPQVSSMLSHIAHFIYPSSVDGHLGGLHLLVL